MDDYVSKPIRKPELYCALKSLTDESFEHCRPDGQNSEQSGTPVDNVTASIIDWNVALENVDGDRDLLDELLRTSLKENEELIQRLDEAIAAKDANAAERFAHTIKGGAHAIAATATAEAAAAIEASAVNDNLDGARRQMPQLRDAIEQLVNAVTQNSSSQDNGR